MFNPHGNTHTNQTPSSFDANNFCMIGSTLIATLLMEKFKFGTIYYGLVQSLGLQILSVMVNINNWSNLSFTNITKELYILLFVIILGLICYRFRNYINYKKSNNEDYLKINIYVTDTITKFLEYVKINKEFYDHMIDINIGDIDKMFEQKIHGGWLYNLTDITCTGLNRQIKFDDKNLDISGYYMWKKDARTEEDKEKKTTKTITMKYIELNILKVKNKQIDTELIIDKMVKYLNESKKNLITLKYIKMMKGNDQKLVNHIVTFYEGKRISIEILENRYIKSFFHQERDRLWSVIKNSTIGVEEFREKGQCARTSLLLYGPPGTGKSTFAYRIAMCLCRQLISLDLRYLSKYDIYQLLQKPAIEYCSSYKEAVFLFEEFDISIIELNLREKKSKIKQSRYFTKMNKSLESEETEIVNKVDQDNNDFSLRDLLEIFQGAIPMEGMILLASTNKYDEIKALCPELFRPGRLTPVYFGYIDKETLQDISKYYFGRKITSFIIPERIQIPTSQIIDLAFESLYSTKQSFNYFCEKLNKLLI